MVCIVQRRILVDTQTALPEPQLRLTRRSFLTKSALATASIAGAASVLSACGTTTSQPVGKTTVSIMLYQGEFSAAEITAAEKATGLKINLIPYDPTVLSAAIAAANPPDLVRVVGAAQIPRAAARNLCEPLDDYFAKSSVLKVSDLHPINDVYKWDGKVQGQGPRYGMAKDWSQDYTIFYNKKHFDKAGLAYPSETTPLSYDQLLDLGKKLTIREHGAIKQYGLSVGWGDFSLLGSLTQMLAQNGASLYNSDYTASNFTSPEVKKALQWYVDWGRARVGIGPFDPNPNGPIATFLADRMALVPFGTWFGGLIKATAGLPEHAGMAPAPLWGKQRLSAAFGAVGLYMSRRSKNKEAAWKLFEYFMGDEPARNRAKSGFGLPSLKSLFDELPSSTPFDAQRARVGKAELNYLAALHYPPYTTDDAITNLIVQYVGPVIRGQASLDAAAEQLKNATDALLQQGKDLIG
jgi:ABC-type glycerol-3-phosphate transport system substrate-binding protein